eukprot:6910033-Prymnesium_polylepis.1
MKSSLIGAALSDAHRKWNPTSSEICGRASICSTVWAWLTIHLPYSEVFYFGSRAVVQGILDWLESYSSCSWEA